MAVKPQVACFERLGAPGWAALVDVVARAHGHGLLVIADAKRGDIDVSAAAYAQAFFGGTATPVRAVPGLGADALTVNPLLGIRRRRAARGGGAGHRARRVRARADLEPRGRGFQERRSRTAARCASGSPDDGRGSEPMGWLSGLSDVGAVVGATAPERLESAAWLMPQRPSCCRAWARRAAGWKISPRRSRPARPGVW